MGNNANEQMKSCWSIFDEKCFSSKIDQKGLFSYSIDMYMVYVKIFGKFFVLLGGVVNFCCRQGFSSEGGGWQ